MECISCRDNDRFEVSPPHERVVADQHWRVAHAMDTALAGWLVLVPRRHVTSIADLTGEEAATLGHWQVRLSRALRDVTGCVKTYVVQFAEREGFEHVHFHVVPRMPDVPDDRRGPAVFHYLNPPTGQGIDDEQRDNLVRALRDRLERTGP